ncbi:MAG: L,D-transpeptidase family protein [Deferrisomatales bacterium]
MWTHRTARLSALLLLTLPLVGGAAIPALGSVLRADKVLVVKSERRLHLLKDGRPVRTYPVALGQEPVGPKQRRGDKRTPEGTYVLDWRNPRSKFYRAIHISYPNREDLERARSKRVSPGGQIMIHGLPRGLEKLGELHALVDWTEGCIAVTNTQMDEIWRLVPNGTPIEIRP